MLSVSHPGVVHVVMLWVEWRHSVLLSPVQQLLLHILHCLGAHWGRGEGTGAQQRLGGRGLSVLRASLQLCVGDWRGVLQ
jgi:hypothetical protein